MLGIGRQPGRVDCDDVAHAIGARAFNLFCLLDGKARTRGRNDDAPPPLVVRSRHASAARARSTNGTRHAPRLVRHVVDAND